MKATRNTVQRDMVLAAVKELIGHPTAEEIYQRIIAKYPTVSRGTVYRNLHLLAEANKIRQVTLPDGADRYDCRLQPHWHIRCERCGRVFDAEAENLDTIGKLVQLPDGFVLHGYDIVLRGVCPDCNKNNMNTED